MVAATDYSALDFLVFTQSGPQSDIPRVLGKVSVAAETAVPIRQSVLLITAMSRPWDPMLGGRLTAKTGH